MKAWLLALRPKTLSAALVPVTVGSALAYSQSTDFKWWISICAFVSALFIQFATNLFNDAIDFKKGADQADRLGPVRVTQSGLLSSRQVMFGGFFCLLISLGFGVPLVMAGGWPIVVVGLLSLFLAYGYTGGPFPLAYVGAGDLFVFVFFGLVAVGGLAFLHLKSIGPDAIVAGAQIGLLATVLIAINNLRDHKQDSKVGKMTLAARFGPRFARTEILFLLVAAFSLGIWWLLTNRLWAAVLPLLALPLALKLGRTIVNAPIDQTLNSQLARAAGTQIIFGFLLSLGLVL